MPIPWFTVEEEKPDIGTVIFKADDYYERLQHISGMWTDNKFLHYEMIKSPQQSASEDDLTEPKPIDPSTIFNASEITNVPQLLAYLDRANMKGALPADQLDFMFDLHKLYIKKMTEFGFATKFMSKKEFTLLENREKWTKLIGAMNALHEANLKEESKVKKRKRMLKPTQIRIFKRLEDLLGLKVSKKGSLVTMKPEEIRVQKTKLKGKRKKSKAQKKSKGNKGKLNKQKKDDNLDPDMLGGKHKDKELRKLEKRIKRSGEASAFFIGSKAENPFAWDYGKTRLFDRKNVKVVGKHFEFTRIYHKISKVLRFARHEPVDWRTITLEEVDKHRFSNDCWMVIKGRVYDVTSFLKLHPGGSQLIMQGAGIDATGIFVSVHPYVVFYQHLEGKQIGTVPNYEEHLPTEWEPVPNFNLFNICKLWWRRPKNPYEKWRPKTSFEQNDTEYIFNVTFPPQNMISRVEDWTITIIDGFKVTVTKLVDTPYVWYGGFDLRTKVMDDTVYRTFTEDFNSVQLKISKSYKVNVKKPIKDYRQDNDFFLSSYSLKDMYKASVVERSPLADGVKLYGISVGMNKYIGCPIGWYVNLRILDETRPYTPVCLNDEFDEKFKDESGDFQTLFFIIKEFKDGDFTSMLHHLPIKRILAGVDIYVSPAMGNFRVEFLFENVDVMLLVAGGTGISVMTRIIQEYIQRKEQMISEKKVVVLFQFAQYREDLIWRQIWQEFTRKYKWFHYYYSLSRIFRYVTVKEKVKEPADGEKGKKKRKTLPKPKVLDFDPSNPHEMYGYPAVNKIEHVLGRVLSHVESKDKDKDKQEQDEKRHKCCVCGPYGFNHSCELMIKGWGKHEEDNVHYFAG